MTMTTADMPEHGEPSRHRGPSGPRAQAPKRRTFTTAYKQRILSSYDSLTDPVERGALLRREGLYHSHLEYWRATLANKGEDSRPVPEKSASGRPPLTEAEIGNQRLRAENERLTAELARTKAALDIAGKVCVLLETLSESTDSDTKPNK